MEGELTSYTGEDSPVSNIFFILSISSRIKLLIPSWIPIFILVNSKNRLIAYFWLFEKGKYVLNCFESLFQRALDINIVVFKII